MDISIIRTSDHKTTKWSGGRTEELIIEPIGAIFQNGDFDYRISIATVEAKESTFTRLVGTNRLLSLLEGEMKLQISEEVVKLSPFKVVEFHGEETVRSFGTGMDFNLMFKVGEGKLQTVQLKKKGKKSLAYPTTLRTQDLKADHICGPKTVMNLDENPVLDREEHFLVFAPEGSLQLQFRDFECILNKGELLQIKIIDEAEKHEVNTEKEKNKVFLLSKDQQEQKILVIRYIK